MQTSSPRKVHNSQLDVISHDSEFQGDSNSKPTFTISGNTDEGHLLRPIWLPLEKSRVPVKYRFHLFLLLTTFLNILYCLLLVPFRIVKQKRRYSAAGAYVFHTNIIQTILSFSFVLVATIYSLLYIRGVLWWSNKKDQKELLNTFDDIINCLLPVFWLVTFWLKRKSFEKLLVLCQGECQSLMEKPVRVTQPKKSSICFINLSIAVVIVQLMYAPINAWYWGYWKWHLMFRGEDVMSAFYLRHFCDFMSGEEFSDSKYFWGSIMSTVIVKLAESIQCFFQIFCVIGAFMVFEACSNFSDKIKKIADGGAHCGQNSKERRHCLKDLSTSYMDLVTVIETINEAFGIFVSVYYLQNCSAVVYLSYYVLSRTTSLHYILIISMRILFFAVVNVVASTGASKVQRYKQWLFEMSVAEYFSETESTNFRFIPKTATETNAGEPDALLTKPASGQQFFLNFMHRQVNPEDVALKGCNFFSVTYSFIGTIVGLMVTFALFILQFRDEQKNNSSSSVAGVCDEYNNVTSAD